MSMCLNKNNIKKKKYTTISKSMIEKIINNNINDAKTISKTFNISLESARRIISATNGSTWKLRKVTDSPTDGYFLSRGIEECVDSVMFDKGLIKAW